MKFKYLPIILVLLFPLLFITPTKLKISAEDDYFSNIKQSFTTPGLRRDKVFLFQATPYEVSPGDKVILVGSGFSADSNHVYFGDKYTINATSTNGSEITLGIPEDFNEGTYLVSVSNNLGINDENQPVYLKITDNPQNPPILSSAEQSGDEIIIKGIGLGSSDTVITPIGNTANIKEGQESISFNLHDLNYYDAVVYSQKGKPTVFPLPIYIENEHGISTSSIIVNIHL